MTSFKRDSISSAVVLCRFATSRRRYPNSENTSTAIDTMTPSASGSRTLRGNGRVIPLGGGKQVVARQMKPTIRIRTAPLKAAWLMRVSVSVLPKIQQSADRSMDHDRGE